MKSLRTTVSDDTFAALEAEAIAAGKTLASHVRHLLDVHVTGATPSTDAVPVTVRLDRQAAAIKRLRRQVETLAAETGVILPS